MKKLLAILIIIITLSVFGYYLYANPELLATVTNLSPMTIALVFIGYAGMIAINAFILHWSLQFVKYRIDYLENLLLTGYSSIVNFFGPLQSGPGFRAIYLKKKHDVKIKDFFVTMIIFYIFFASINGIILLISILTTYSSAWTYLLVIVGVIAASAVAFVLHRKNAKVRKAVSMIRLNDPLLWNICFGAFASIIITAFIYHVELVSVAPDTTIAQTIVYTAAANFALFVALTPGAIGFRESFILLTQQLHGIETSVIIGAGVIDRALYVLFLLLLFVLLLIINKYKHLSVFDKVKQS